MFRQQKFGNPSTSVCIWGTIITEKPKASGKLP
jgi:hypothetical protein